LQLPLLSLSVKPPRSLPSQRLLDRERQNRAMERAGRTQAAQECRRLVLELQRRGGAAAVAAALSTNGGGGDGEDAADGAATTSGDGALTPVPLAAAAAAAAAGPAAGVSAFTFRPIGVLRSCFARRNGTPRQPLLVPAARASLTLAPGLPADLLLGLDAYSHAWVLYVPHENTDLVKTLGPTTDGAAAAAAFVGVRGKVRPPRLNGARLGVLATRSPHRPCPIGLSLVAVAGVDGRTLHLRGADILDGTPVLDIKPYIPFCEALPHAVAPDWVRDVDDDPTEPLRIAAVEWGEGAAAAVGAAWAAAAARLKGGSLYDSAEEFGELVRQVLSRDIRSAHHRLHADAAGAGAGAGAEGRYHVILERRVEVRYDVVQRDGGDRAVIIRGGRLAAQRGRTWRLGDEEGGGELGGGGGAGEGGGSASQGDASGGGGGEP